MHFKLNINLRMKIQSTKFSSTKVIKKYYLLFTKAHKTVQFNLFFFGSLYYNQELSIGLKGIPVKYLTRKHQDLISIPRTHVKR